MDKKQIIRNFSRHALSYDKLATVQKKVASELLEMTGGRGVKSILEIGCGTGIYTALLRGKFKSASILAVDISKEMIAQARQKLKGRGVKLIVADGECLDQPGSFDLITSNACFQWMDDLEKAIQGYKALLNKNGAISFSMFGPSTFVELRSSLKSVSGPRTTASSDFISRERLGLILGKNFKKTKIKASIRHESFDSLMELLNKIKNTGVNGGSFPALMTPGAVKAVERAYRQEFGMIKATYEVFLCEAFL